ncbi:MAG: hypothetical protein HC893_00065 [Chloroflexaceae bacterium]|nr:hypothetical protein [Chloroflexaceae bacterium]
MSDIDIERVLTRGVQGFLAGVVQGMLEEMQTPAPPQVQRALPAPAKKYQDGSDPVYEVSVNLKKFPRGVEFNRFVRHSGWPASEVKRALQALKRRGQAGVTHDHTSGQSFWYPL